MAHRETRHNWRRRVIARYYDNVNKRWVITQNQLIGPTPVSTRDTGPNIPGYRQVIARRGDATTTLAGTKYIRPKIRPLFYSFKYNASGPSEGHGNPHTPAYGGISFIASSEAATQASQAFNKDYTSKVRKIQGGVFLGELRQTVAFVRNPVKGIYNAADTLANNLHKIKKESRNWRRYKDALADSWLGFAFAARPLANDANEGAKALADLLTRRTPDLLKVKGYGESESFVGETEVGIGFIGIGNYLAARQWETRTSSVLIRGAVNSIAHPAARAPQTLGLGLFDTVPTAWELVPWSFLVDYFTNVGDCLDSLRLRYVAWCWLNRTVRNSSTVSVSDAYSQAADHAVNSMVVSGGSCQLKRIYVDRSKTGMDVFENRLMFEVPGLTKASKWMNISALASKFLSSRPGR